MTASQPLSYETLHFTRIWLDGLKKQSQYILCQESIPPIENVEIAAKGWIKLWGEHENLVSPYNLASYVKHQTSCVYKQHFNAHTLRILFYFLKCACVGFCFMSNTTDVQMVRIFRGSSGEH